MKVRVKLAPPYSDVSGQRNVELELSEPATVGSLLSELERLYPEINCLLLDESGRMEIGSNFFVTIGPHVGNLASILAEGDSVRIFPAIGGGSGAGSPY